MRLAILANPDNLHVQRWIKFLAGRDHELLLIADPHTRTRLPGIQTVEPRWNLASNILAFRLTPKPHGNSLWKFLHYRPLIRNFDPDLVHGFEAYYSGLATAWSGPYPKVLTPWGKDIHHDAFQGPIWKWILTRSLRGADRITANDESLPQFLNILYGILPEKVQAFSWGVDLSVFRSDYKMQAARWRERLKIPRDSPVIFSPRRFDRYWGAEILIEAIPEILRLHPQAVFVILACSAAPEFLAAMKKRVEAQGCGAAVRWIEQTLSPKEMAEVFNLADLYVSLPQKDLLALTVLEGMACGCLPILADLPAYEKHVRQKVNGWENALLLKERTASELARQIDLALSNPELRRAASAFNVERMRIKENAAVNMLKIEEVYAQAVEARRRAKGERRK